MNKIVKDEIFYFVDGASCDYNIDINSENYRNWISRKTLISLENVKYRCHKPSSAVKTIVKTYFKYTPLNDSNFVNSLMNEIVLDLENPQYKEVIVFGFSFGGAIVNRVAEIINQKTDLNDNISKLKMVTFGSIYIPLNEMTISNINILNYVSSSDVAIKCNKIIPMSLEDMPITLINDEHIVCKLPIENKSTKTKQICLYKYSTRSPQGRPLCRDRHIDNSTISLGRRGAVSILKWTEHINYNELINVIIQNYRRVKLGVFDGNFINVYDGKKSKILLTDYYSNYLLEPSDDDSIATGSLTDKSSIPELNNNDVGLGGSMKYRKSMKAKKSKKSRKHVKSKKSRKSMKAKK